MDDGQIDWVISYYKDMKLKVLPSVYDPAEDSFLLADNLDIKQGDKVLDIGCGSGIQSLVAAKKGAKVIAVDINPEAVKNTKINAADLDLEDLIQVRQSNLFENVPETDFDVIIFNPPYLPSGGGLNNALSKAWDGGKTGREIISDFLKEAKKHLKKGGKIFFVISSITGKEEVEKTLKEAGYKSKVIASQKMFFEELFVFEAERV